MKPDKFDETIRRKLEGIQPSFQEEDWSKFKSYQTAHLPQSYFQRFGRTMMYTAASVAAAMMVFANVYQYRQNQQLDQQLEQLKGQLSQKDNIPVRISSRIDTVYITKYVPVKSSQTNQYDASVSRLNDVNADNLTPDNEVAESLKNVGRIIRQNPNKRIGEVYKEQSVEKETSGSSENNNSVNLSNRENEDSPLINLSPSKTRPNTDPATPITAEAGLPKPSIADISTIELSLLEPKQIVEDLVGIAPAEIQVKRYAYAQLATSTVPETVESTTTLPPPPSISFRGVKFRMGTGLNLGDRYTGYSVNTSLLLGKYWSLDLGLSRAKITGPEFYTEDLFKVKTQRDFQSWRKSTGVQPPLATPQAIDIKTSVNLVRMPVALTYRWPIKDGFTLLMSGGTNLNISANQKYSFVMKERNGDLELKEGTFDVKSSLSNDVVLAAGVEKQWRHLVVQAETYAAPYLQKPTYLTDNRNIGVRFRVLYQFGKK